MITLNGIIVDISKFSITPKLFEFVKFSSILFEYVYNYIIIIYQYPFSVGFAFHTSRICTSGFPYFFIYRFRDSINLCIRITRTNDKKSVKAFFTFLKSITTILVAFLSCIPFTTNWLSSCELISFFNLTSVMLCCL